MGTPGFALTGGPDREDDDARKPRASAVPSWRVWWMRNRSVLGFAAAQRIRRTPSSDSFREWLLDHRSEFQRSVREQGPGTDLALLHLGMLSKPADLFTLLDAARLPGLSGQAAILSMGLYGNGSAVGHLEALFRDTRAGRYLRGDVKRPVPPSHRAAAAMALGLSGVPSAYNALRWALKEDHLSDALGAAALVALSFSGSASDGACFARCVRKLPGHPLMREAAAVSLGRLAAHIPGARRLLLGVLRSDPEHAGRGAAVALWYKDEASGDGAREGEALRDAALNSRDHVTRVLALVALAGRGDPAAEPVIEAALRRAGQQRTYAILATGLLAKADPRTRIRGQARLARFQESEPAAVEVARHILMDPDLAPRPHHGRTIAHLAGGNASFSGVTLLGSILDMSARLSQ